MIKTMDKNAQMERIYHDQQLQVYMYDFMYVELDTMPPEDNFSDTRTFVDNYKKMSTPGPVPKNWLEFSYICSEDYELDVKFDETEMKKIRPHIQR